MSARALRKLEQAGAFALLMATMALIVAGVLKAAWWAWGLVR